MNLKEAALSYARAGFKVFPLQPDTKSKHVLKSWIEEASSDEQIIRRWWNYNPNYNIGIKTGNGLCVIDIDCKNGKDGMKSLETIKHIFQEKKIVKTNNQKTYRYEEKYYPFVGILPDSRSSYCARHRDCCVQSRTNGM